jgi:hypothetical protein
MCVKSRSQSALFFGVKKMLDTILVLAGVGLFLLGIVYVYACERV